MKHCLLVGTYSSNGIHKLNFENGILTSITSDNNLENCSYLCNYDDVNFNVVEYSNNDNYKNGLVVARNADLSIINTIVTNGSSPCYIHLDITRNLLYTANYMDGSLDVFSLNEDKSLKKLIFSKSFTAHSHIHCILLSPDNNFLFVDDLGDNKLYAYKIIFDGNLFDLTYISCYTFPNNSNPRHFIIKNNDIFLITENSCELYHLTFSETEGFKILEKQSILPDNIKNSNNYTGCAIKSSKNYIYVSIRGLNKICVFSISPNLELKQHISCYGETPRDLFLLDNYLLCSNQTSNSITIFETNKNTGKLSYKNIFKIEHPACIIKL